MTPGRLREAELALLNAPFDPEGWTRALELFAWSNGSSCSNLVAVGGPLPLSLNMFVGREAERSARYFSQPHLWGSCNWRVNSSGRPMTIQHEPHYAAYRQQADTSDYDDAVSDLDIPFGCQAVIFRDSRTFLGIADLRSSRDGPCDAAALQSFGALLRPMQRSLRLQMALSGESADLMLDSPALLSSAVVLVDRHGCVCGMSPAAEALAEEGGPIRLQSLLFELADPVENRLMQSILARLLSEPGRDDRSWADKMIVGRRSGRRFVARAFRIPQERQSLGFDAHASIIFEAERKDQQQHG